MIKKRCKYNEAILILGTLKNSKLENLKVYSIQKKTEQQVRNQKKTRTTYGSVSKEHISMCQHHIYHWIHLEHPNKDTFGNRLVASTKRKDWKRVEKTLGTSLPQRIIRLSIFYKNFSIERSFPVMNESRDVIEEPCLCGKATVEVDQRILRF